MGTQMIKFLENLFFISFLLNFAWEISQMPFYSEMGMGLRDNYLEFLRIHWEVSLKDALMVVVVCLVIGFLLRNWQWAKPRKAGSPDQSSAIDLGIKTFNGGWVILWLSLPIWQGIIEYYSVYIYSRWAYADSMPLLLGIGLLPLLQMLILPSLAVLLSRHLFTYSRE